MNFEPNGNSNSDPSPGASSGAADQPIADHRLTPDSLGVASGSEAFVHGLLTFRHHDTRETQEARIRRVLNAITDRVLVSADAHAPAARTAPLPRGRRLRAPARRNSIPVALVALFLAGAAALLAQPMQSTAQATVQSALDAARSPGDRRYDVRIITQNDAKPPDNPTAIVDTREPNLLLIRTFTPDGKTFVAGRDAAGEWVIAPDGVIDRENARARWPRWAMVDETPVFAESVESLLEMLSRQFVVRRDRPMPLPERSRAAANDATEPRPTFEHLIGERRGIRPGPKQVLLWLAPESKQVERIELRFPQNFGPKPEGRPEGRPGPGRGPGPGPGPAPGPRLDGGERPMRFAPPGRPPRGDRSDLPRPDADMHDRPSSQDGLRRERREGPRGPLNEPDPNGLRDPDDARRPDVRPPHVRGGFGPRGPGPGAGPGAGPGPGGPGGPGRPGMEGRPPPPKAVIIERVDATGISDDWFSPEAHVRAATTQDRASMPPGP
jgi:hypothetical protein